MKKEQHIRIPKMWLIILLFSVSVLAAITLPIVVWRLGSNHSATPAIEYIIEILGASFSIIALILLIKEFHYVNYCGKRRYKKAIKDLEKIFSDYRTEYVFYAGDNSKKFMNGVEKNTGTGINYIEIDLIPKMKHILIDKSTHFQTAKFYGVFSNYRRYSNLRGKRIIIFDDIIITGETDNIIRAELVNRFGASPENIFIVSYGAYGPIHGTQRIPHKSLYYFNVVNEDHKYFWRKDV